MTNIANMATAPVATTVSKIQLALVVDGVWAAGRAAAGIWGESYGLASNAFVTKEISRELLDCELGGCGLAFDWRPNAHDTQLNFLAAGNSPPVSKSRTLQEWFPCWRPANAPILPTPT